MKIFDFNIHLPLAISRNNSQNMIFDESSLTPAQLLKSFGNYFTQITANCDKANLMLFNQNILNLPEAEYAIDKIKKSFNSYLTFLIDFRSKEAFNYIDKIKNIKGSAIKFHSYVQHITEQDFSLILELSKYAEEKKLTICIDTSYGTFKMYNYDNLKLAATIIEHIKKTPIILLHSGGKRILEAFLLAESGKNIYLETSFTLNAYINSSVEQDLAFAYKKLGSEKIIYGTDFPYVNFNDSLKTVREFFDKYKFTSKEIENIFYNNAIKILSESITK